ncbi:MAG: DUF4886 domain-containing protein [Clostridia bacterium]|nr:DUF4886 domain-containing protein [Clostridia bacterium]
MRFTRILLSLVLICTLFASCNTAETATSGAPPVPESLKILCIGNSFSADTTEHLADIAKAVGIEEVKIANLYIGGCSIKRHYNNAVNRYASYEYHFNDGSGWQVLYHRRIDDVLTSDNWDWVSIQHGTADGSRYAEEGSYEKLPALVAYIRERVNENTKIAFNMTWVGERNSHEELKRYGNNQERYYKAIAALTEETVLPIDGLDRISPTGTAVQNIRTAYRGMITRDGYHLTHELGCYLAGLTFFKALTDLPIDDISWAPDGVSDDERALAVRAANTAVESPFTVTDCNKQTDD